MRRERTKVVVAMSGGVDSSVAAGLLAQQGYEVHGVTMAFDPCRDDGEVSWCCGAGAAEEASAVAEKIGASHEVIKCDDLFEAAVLWPAWQEYSRGRTPSPCIACNRNVKFELLLVHARKVGAEKIATGHYARLDDSTPGSSVLLRAQDRHKDQSYFLFSLTAEQRAVALFPLGELDKPQVRQVAKEMGFENADRAESQDACFRAPDGFAEGLRVKFEVDQRPGVIASPDGDTLGKHGGVHNFTIGQRKGTGISLGRPAYVVDIDSVENRVILSTREQDLLAHELRASGVVWSDKAAPREPLSCQAQIRYRHRAAQATVSVNGGGLAHVSFEEPVRAITPGQAVVFYLGDRVLGGGWIEHAAYRNEEEDD
ncbi:MAG: tRNA 2-thiouridine(34) synthase MnmA [Deltaproteobacteria bacterium]|nr:tRNA 2-thiouridine(34) synthase MnmA [Deltaproteobacteria bacterium]